MPVPNNEQDFSADEWDYLEFAEQVVAEQEAKAIHLHEEYETRAQQHKLGVKVGAAIASLGLAAAAIQGSASEGIGFFGGIFMFVGGIYAGSHGFEWLDKKMTLMDSIWEE